MNNKKVIIITSIVTAVAVFTLSALFFLSPLGIVLVGRLSDSAVGQSYGKLIKIEKIINSNFMGSYNPGSLMDSAVHSYVASLRDPYSFYYDRSEFKDLTSTLDGEYRGIGVVVFSKNNKIVVKSVNPSSPAEKAGIIAGDIIIAINSVNYSGEELASAVNAIKDTKVGKTVSLDILRGEETKKIDIKIEKVKEILVTSRMLDGNLGYVDLSSFGTNVTEDFLNAVDSLKNSGAKGFVIDLRSNPGGSLDSAVGIADIFLPEGNIVTIRDKKGDEEIYTSDKAALNMPVCVLINEHSASASEVVAGALKDYKLATLVGKKTFGKGVVQSVMDLGDGSGLSLTIAKYYTPSGECIHGVGIEPDIEVDLPEGVEFIPGEELYNDTQLQAAVEELKSKIK